MFLRRKDTKGVEECRNLTLYKGLECANYRETSLLSVGREGIWGILIERVISNSDRVIGEEQCGLREGRGCIH